MFTTRWDFRVPGGTPEQRQEHYARALAQAAYLQDHGPQPLMVSEHHTSDDGYLPSPLAVGPPPARNAVAYQEWHGENASYVVDTSRTVEEVRAAGVYLVTTADELVDRCRTREVRLVTSHPGCGGLPTEPSWEHVRLLCERVMPALATAPGR